MPLYLFGAFFVDGAESGAWPKNPDTSPDENPGAPAPGRGCVGEDIEGRRFAEAW